jgi:hypothetical protein
MRANDGASDLYSTGRQQFTQRNPVVASTRPKSQKFLNVRKNGILNVSPTTTDIDVLESVKESLPSRDRIVRSRDRAVGEAGVRWYVLAWIEPSRDRTVGGHGAP